MIKALRHRGPDASGAYSDDAIQISLGQTRLSIIDLNERSNQPFHSGNGRYVAVYNGEVYNFQSLRQELIKMGVEFRTTSDTEVVVEAFAQWGEQSASRLEGMFAAVILDKKERKLFLLRDRLGKKPLFYFISPDAFAFASEIKALVAAQKVLGKFDLNMGALSSFLHLGYIPEPETIYNNVFKFPAGSFGTITENLQLKTTSYGRVEHIRVTSEIKDPLTAKETLKQLMRDAVDKRLISDVPLGVFLSGGTDSALVTAFASKSIGDKLKTFSIGFHEGKFDESTYARQVANAFKTDHVSYLLPQSEAGRILEKYLGHFDEPFADTSSIPTMLVSELARKEVKVALTGDGGDELFMGYGAYTWAERLATTSWKWASPILSNALRATSKSSWKRVGQLLDLPERGDLCSHIFSQEQYFFSQREIRDSLFQDPNMFRPFVYMPGKPNEHLQGADRQALFDLQFYLKDDLLVKVDRASMFHGLECRSPLLDDGVVRFALSLHPSLKIRNGNRKWILKQVLKEFLPASLVDRPKWGFGIPLATWLRNDLNYLMRYLEPAQLKKTGVFNESTIQNLTTRFLNGEEYLYNRLWVVIVLQRFLLTRM
jgi:asparagine synthase (glutamine-hydrolysing)